MEPFSKGNCKSPNQDNFEFWNENNPIKPGIWWLRRPWIHSWNFPPCGQGYKATVDPKEEQNNRNLWDSFFFFFYKFHVWPTQSQPLLSDLGRAGRIKRAKYFNWPQPWEGQTYYTLRQRRFCAFLWLLSFVQSGHWVLRMRARQVHSHGEDAQRPP